MDGQVLVAVNDLLAVGVLNLVTLRYMLVVYVTFFVVLLKQVEQNYLSVTEKQSFHIGTVVEEGLDDGKDLVSIFKLNGKQIHVEDDVDDGG